MKKALICLLCLLLCLLLWGCGHNIHENEGEENISLHSEAAYDENEMTENSIIRNKGNSFIFAWVSYFEMRVTPQRNNEETYRNYMRSLFENMKKVGVNNAFVHVRAFGDAFYYSDIFPESDYIKVNGEVKFDPLQLAIETGKEYGIKIHAWLNPYRVGKIEGRPKDDIIRRWHEENTGDTFSLGEEVYLNPASLEVQRLIIEGAEELLKSYDLGGIHIDDYFYPENCGSFDKEGYEKYLSNGGQLSLADYRRENVSALVSALYRTVKSCSRDKLFTVSPCGNLERAYNTTFADAYLWGREEGYADFILPQIYFGFEHETVPFEECFNMWLEIADRDKLLPGLALYKAGQEDIFAGEGESEWQKSSDILKRQAELIFANGCKGFSLYSASYMNFSQTFTADELNNLKSVIE